jgi:lipoprotein NlpD
MLRTVINRSSLWLLIAVGLVSLAGCSSRALMWIPDFHEVERGETLYSIAGYYQLDEDDLRSWNGMGRSNTIYSGQKLALKEPAGGAPAPTRAQGRSRPPSSATSSPKATGPGVKNWLWPINGGTVISGFGESPKTESGVLIRGRGGQAVVAAASGEIVYSGSGLKGYGNLLIIKHNSQFLSAYGHNDRLRVHEGQRVTRGQQIASMGNDLDGRPALHFEIRREGVPVDPLRYVRPPK